MREGRAEPIFGRNRDIRSPARCLCWAQIRARRINLRLLWATIVASTTPSTTLADFGDRFLGIGYAGGSLWLLGCVLLSSLAWWRTFRQRLS